MNVLVLGGTGFIGRNLCDTLNERGHDVTALSRSAERSALPEGVESYAGDVTEFADIEPAFEEQEAVYFLPALSPLFKPEGGNEMHELIHVGGTRNALEAARKHDVERFVHMSALGADPNGPTAYLRAKGRAEALVRDSDLDWVVFRPSVVFGEGGEFVSFTKEMKSVFAPFIPIYPLPGGGSTRFQPIWVGDFVPMLVAAVEEDTHRHEVYEIGGPEVLTLADVAKLAFRAEDRTITIVSIPMAIAKLGLTIMGPLPFIPFSGDQGRSLEMDNTVTENNIGEFDVQSTNLQTLSAYLGLTD